MTPPAKDAETARRDAIAARLLSSFSIARERRRAIEPVWQACYDHALPAPAGTSALYDATAADAAEQLAASLLAELTPPWSRWFGLSPARAPHGDAAGRIAAAALDDAAITLQGHFDRSNFAIEMHQAFLDLVVAGTGVLLVEEAPLGESSAFRFTAVPLQTAVLNEGPDGRLTTLFREQRLTLAALLERFPDTAPQPQTHARDNAPPDAGTPLRVLEAIWPEGSAVRHAAILAEDPDRPVLLAEGYFAEHPAVAFRWLKGPGEIWGRGPVMKALPDIRTANKVVELVLKNASIAATGIWQAEDDGVLNPATVRLTPGAIIPKAPGSSGLTPLAAPGNFDVSQLVLNDLRTRIRGALLADRIGPQQDARRTATEVLERAAEAARLLGATYGRLQAELLTPLVTRCLGILRRRGEIAHPSRSGGQEPTIRYESPLARVQGRADAANTLLFLQSVASLGGAAAAQVDAAAATRWLARTLGAPAEVLVPLGAPVEMLPPRGAPVEMLPPRGASVEMLPPRGAPVEGASTPGAPAAGSSRPGVPAEAPSHLHPQPE